MGRAGILLQALVAGALAMAGTSCTSAETMATWRADMLHAVAANGAYTLRCPVDQVRASVYDRPGRYGTRSYFADGCGQRIVYEVACGRGQGCRFEMIGRFSTARGGPAGDQGGDSPATGSAP